LISYTTRSLFPVIIKPKDCAVDQSDSLLIVSLPSSAHKWHACSRCSARVHELWMTDMIDVRYTVSCFLCILYRQNNFHHSQSQRQPNTQHNTQPNNQKSRITFQPSATQNKTQSKDQANNKTAITQQCKTARYRKPHRSPVPLSNSSILSLTPQYLSHTHNTQPTIPSHQHRQSPSPTAQRPVLPSAALLLLFWCVQDVVLIY